MSESHTTNGTVTAALAEARDKLRLLKIQRATARLEAEMHVMESWGLYTGYSGSGWGSFVDPNDAIRDPDLWDGNVLGPLPGRRDIFDNSQPGILWPIIRNEMDFDTMRASARVLSDMNDLAKGIIRRLRNFTVRTGFTYQVLPKDKLGPEEVRIALVLAQLVQLADDEFCQRNQWADREKESCVRKIRDGEFFHRLFLADPERGLTDVRFIEPEQVRRPLGSPPEWSWGIHTDPDDVEAVKSYAVEYKGDAQDWEDVPAREVIHGKANVDRTIKRGLSDFYCTREGLEGCRKLRRALRVGAAMQASIPWIEQYDVARQATVQQGANQMIDQLQPNVTNPFSGKPLNLKQYLPGQVLYIGKGRNYLPGPVAQATNNIHIAIGQYDVRSIGARWDMPEYMIGGDASNNNFASILVAGAPFVIGVETEQDDLKKDFLQVHWQAIKNYADAGRFRVNGRVIDYATLRRLVDLHCTPPQVAIANKLEEAQVDNLDIQNGVLSKQTRREKLGLDNDKEKANIDKDPVLKQPSPGGGQGDDPKSPLAALMQGDPRQARRPQKSPEAEQRDSDIDSFFLTSRVREVTDASGHKHGSDGKFSSTSGSASGSHARLSSDIEGMEATPQGRKTLARGAELAARVKSGIKAGVAKVLDALDAETKGGISLLSAGHGVAGAAHVFNSVFQCVHEEVFEAALADHSLPGAHALGVAASHLAAKAESALLKAVAWSWRKMSESQEHFREAKLTDADRHLLAQLSQVAADAIGDVLGEAGIDKPAIDLEAIQKRLAQLLQGADK